jgi:hypothetical protein
MEVADLMMESMILLWLVDQMEAVQVQGQFLDVLPENMKCP